MTHYSGIRVRNFRGIHELTLDDLGEINLITGLNDVGKSTLLEAIFLEASGPFAGQNALRAFRGPNGVELAMSFGPDAQAGPWDSLFHRFETDRPVEVRTTHRGGSHTVRLERGTDTGAIDLRQLTASVTDGARNPGAALTVRDINNDGPGTTYHQHVRVSVLSGEDPNSQTLNVEVKVEPQPTSPYKLAHFIHGQNGPDLAEGYSNLRRSRATNDLLEALKLVDSRIENLEVLAVNGKSTLHADFGDGPLIPINLLGDGARSVANYLVAMTQCRHGALLLDEVGAGLHHTLQAGLWRVLARAARKFDVQVFATTHSDECIRGAVEGVRNDNNELRVIRMWRSEQGETGASMYSGSELQAAFAMNAELR